MKEGEAEVEEGKKGLRKVSEIEGVSKGVSGWVEPCCDVVGCVKGENMW